MKYDQEKADQVEFNFNKVVEVIRELTDRKTDTHGKKTLYLALRAFLQAQLDQLDTFKQDSEQADKNITKICEGYK